MICKDSNSSRSESESVSLPIPASSSVAGSAITQSQPQTPICQTQISQENVDNTESKKKWYVCPYDGCQKKFKESGNLKTHIRIHVRHFPIEITKKIDWRKTICL